jgi:hypothetical protein
MSTDKLPSEGEKIFPLSAWYRWQLYHRLQASTLNDKCSIHQPLQVRIDRPRSTFTGVECPATGRGLPEAL